MHVGIGELPWHFTLLYELHLDIYMISNSDVGGLVSQLASSPEFIIILIYSVALGNLPILYIYIYTARLDFHGIQGWRRSRSATATITKWTTEDTR